MARTKHYQHFCPVARSLEMIGEKWSLLIVRDLLMGPQRFTDLLRYLSDITPKWLTLRLRDLEAAGIVERDSQAGRREVWYRLTAKGRNLAPVVEALAMWGMQYAMRPPLPGEAVHPEQSILAVTISLNHRGVRLSRSATWVVRFQGGGTRTIRFDGARWSAEAGEAEADVAVTATTEAWIGFLTAAPEERRRRVDDLHIEGEQRRVEEFLATFMASARSPS